MELPPATLRRLFLLKKYCAEGPIIVQVRKAVEQYIKQKESEKIGTSVEDMAETIERHEREERINP